MPEYSYTPTGVAVITGNASTGSVGGDGAHNNMQPFICIPRIIKVS